MQYGYLSHHSFMKIVIPAALITALAFQSCITLDKQLIKYPNRFNRHVEKNGKKIKTGIWIEALDSGSMFIVNYERGIMEGKAKLLSASGEVRTYNYKNDKRNGWARFYNSMGFEYSRILFKDDEIVSRRWYTPRF